MNVLLWKACTNRPIVHKIWKKFEYFKQRKIVNRNGWQTRRLPTIEPSSGQRRCLKKPGQQESKLEAWRPSSARQSQMGVDTRQMKWLPSFGKWLGLGPFSIFIIEKKQRNIERKKERTEEKFTAWAMSITRIKMQEFWACNVILVKSSDWS